MIWGKNAVKANISELDTAK